jgi:membrane carboxypeptidase/penicillin-binding protein PbpC
MHNVSGITGAGPLWAEIMVAAGRERSTRFTRPAGLAEREICPLSGELAGPHCGSTSPELFVQGTEPRATCSIHREITLDRRNGLRAGPGCPEAEVERRVFLVYPAVYRSWAASQRIEPPPTLDSPLCPHAAEGVKVSIRFPVEGDRYFIDPDLRRPFQRVPLEATVEGWVREVRWLVDGREVTRAGYPYSASWALAPGRHRIEAALPDGPRSAPVTITVK